MSSFTRDLRALLRAPYSIIQIETHEEARCVELLHRLAAADHRPVWAKNDSGQYTEQTQTDARNDFNGARRTANTANVFYGLGVGMAALSVVFFTVDFGSDVADEDELSKRTIRDLKVAPAVTRDAAGVGTFFRF